MKIFKSITITPALRSALDQARAALNKRSELDRAVSLNHDALSAATLSIGDLAIEAASLDAAAAQAEASASIDPSRKSEVAKANKTADSLAVSLEGKHREIGRRNGAHELLVAQARAADEEIVAAKNAINQAVAGLRDQLLDALAKDLATECKPLMEVIQGARAINSAMPHAINLGRYLESVQVIDPRTFRITSSEDRPPFSGTDLLDVASSSVELPADTRETLQQIADINKALAAHRPFVPPTPLAQKKPYVVQSSGATERKRWADARAAAGDYQTAPSTWRSGSRSEQIAAERLEVQLKPQ